jgi:hypothetical protein
MDQLKTAMDQKKYDPHTLKKYGVDATLYFLQFQTLKNIRPT